MKNLIKTILLLLVFTVFAACGGSEKEEKEQVRLGDHTKTQTTTPTKATSSKDMIDMTNKGIGPVASVTLSPTIDQASAARGKEVFNNMCTACHKIERKFIGPKIEGVTKIRTPEWIMNMIMNPEEMIQKDPIAKQLLIESNMAVMADQNISQDEARDILEYFRQIDN